MFVSVKKWMMKIGGLLLVLPLLLVGCVGGDDTMELPTKQWGDIHITVQTRPPKVKAGMVEFMVLAAIKGRKPEIGVYRRVVQVRDPARDVLAVKLRVKKSDKEKILYFPLALQQPTNTASE